MARTIEAMAAHMREAYATGYLEGMRGPTSFLAERFETRFVPPRATDGWFDGRLLHEFQADEAAAFQSVMPDAHLADVTVLTRADDQIIVVMTLRGTLLDGSDFACPLTMIYDVKDGEIVRVVGLYDQQRLAPFAGAFAELAKRREVPIEMPPPGQG